MEDTEVSVLYSILKPREDEMAICGEGFSNRAIDSNT